MPCAFDADSDEVCDGADNCPDVVNPAQDDGDNDGLGDACDPCTNGVPILRSKLKLGRQHTPPGDDKLKFAGELTLPTPYNPPLNPPGNGVRLLIDDANGQPLLDVTIPGGVYDAGTGTGWRLSSSAWRFQSRTGVLGIVKVQLKPSVSTQGLIKFSVGGKNGAYVVPGNGLPLRATLVLDPPTATTGQCGEIAYAPERCVFNGSGTAVSCR
jgi:hypothetical protein